MTRTQPLGRLVALQFRHVAPQAGAHPTLPVLRVHLRVPDGSYHHHDIPNGDWLLNNEALQFLALWGYKPSDIGDADSTIRNCLPDKTCVPVAPRDAQWHEDVAWGLAQSAFESGEDALRAASWFDAGDSSSNDETDSDAAQGGGGDGGPNTGNRGGVEEPSDSLNIEVPTDSDRGIEVTIE